MKRVLKAWLGGLLIVAGSARAELPEVPEAAVDELGTTSGTPQMNGFVFIEGRYIAPPYTVTRKGNGLFINRIQIEQPVAWSAVTGEVEPPKKALDADGDFEVVDPAEVKPAEPAAPAAPAAPAEPAAPKPVKSIDDLFADDAPAATPAAPAAPVAPAAPAAPPAVKSIDELFADDAPAPAPAAGALPAAPAAPAAAAARSPEEAQRVKDELRASLDARRKGYEQALGRGEIYFFSQRHSRLNGNYGTARTLMGVLPSALRGAQSPQELMQRLNQGGVYFVDLAICGALYKNKLAFPLLEDRLRRIQESEALEAARRKPPQAW